MSSLFLSFVDKCTRKLVYARSCPERKSLVYAVYSFTVCLPVYFFLSASTASR